MSDLITNQFERLIADLDVADPWPALTDSGFLDLLRSEDDGGSGLELADLAPLAMAVGRQTAAPFVIETMLARLADPEAMNTGDPEKALVAAGVEAAAARNLAAVVTAALMAGAVERLLEMTIDYASTRKQFGREIGKFQAVQHQIAVLAEEAMAARMAAEAACRGAPLEVATLTAAVAKIRCGEAAQVACAVAHAVHGAIGVSHEFSLHLLTGALQRGRMAHGGEAWWARRLGRAAIADTRPAVDIIRGL